MMRIIPHVSTHKHKVDNNPEEILAQNTYNDLSQLESRKVGGTVLGSGLQTIDYKYNIRGWMTKINDPNNLGTDLFGYKINYNQVEGLENPNTDFMDLKVKQKYNGNIAEVSWKTLTEDNEPLKKYGYVYDGLNRLLAGFYQKAGSESAKEYFEKMDYDLNGNITRLQRSEGVVSGSTALKIDNLKYDYTGNRLTKVTDEQQNPSGYPYLATHNTIGYDENGNMTSLLDKGLNSIAYNHLNLPTNFTYGGGKGTSAIINNLYRADGTKLKKFYNNVYFFSVTETDYLDGFQYDNKIELCIGCPGSSPILKFVPTSEGYFDFEKNLYIYNYTDHLGNVRLSYSDTSGDGVVQPRDMTVKHCEDLGDGNIACSSVWVPGEIVEINNYYPFGLLHNYVNTTQNSYQYKYNGKELQETGMYDYGARFYMPDLGRWGVVDPLAERYQPFSSYNYVLNNPISNVDPDGMQVENDYQLLKNGEVKLIKTTEEKSDTLYASNDKGEVDKSKGSVTVKKAKVEDATIISQLETNANGKETYGTSTNGADARRVFQFGADNSNVEWSIGGFDTEGGGRIGYADTYLVGTSGVLNKVTAPWEFGIKNLTFENLTYAGHTHPFTRKAQKHDNDISKPGIYNFIYYTGAGYGDKHRENHFVPYWLESNPKTGKNEARTKSNARQIKLPNLIP